MREIKFRAIGAIVICWIYGYFVQEHGFCYIVNDNGKHQVRADSICQFTCRKDKNGKEIYEEDIVTRYDEDFEHQDTQEVKFSTHGGFQCNMGQFIPSDVEVIGNNYENPELLKSRTEPKGE